MKRLLLIAAAAAAVFISGCATDAQVAHSNALAAYYNAEATKATAAASVERVRLQAQGNAKKEAYAKLDSESAERVLVAEANAEAITNVAKNGHGGGVQAQAALKAPEAPRSTAELILDYGLRFWGEVRGTVRDVAPALVTIRQSRDQRDANIHRDDTLVAIEGQRQQGETSRIQSVAAIAGEVAHNQPSQVYNIGRDGIIGGGSQSNNNSTTDRHDTHACPGGSPAAGGGGGAGAPAPSGGTPAPGGAGAPSGPGPGGNC